MSDEQFIQQFQVNYNRVVNYIGGGADQKLLMSLASHYTLKEKQFSGVILRNLMETIDEERTFRYQIDSPMSYKLATHLLKEQDIHNAIQQLNKNDNLLKEVRFKQSPFRVIGALFLQEDPLQHAKRAKQLFNEMNHYHRFLTSNEDIPYVVLLTSNINSSNDAMVQAETMHRYYQELRQHHFTMGNHLQALTQIMTIYSKEYNEVFMQYIVQLRAALLKYNINVKKIHYPFIGILALAATGNMKLNEIVHLHNQLMEQKAFRHAKEYALIVAIQKIVKDLVGVQEVVDMSLLSQLNYLFEIADFALEFSSFIPSGVSDLLDFLN